MTFADDLAAELPPPHDDEPESLRQDIVDELADHLHCAVQRELLASGGCQSPDPTNEQTAYNRVLARFGNPATLARRLWLDEMKERLMAQKMTVVMATITAAAALAACVFLWRFATESRTAQQALVEAQQQASAQLVDKLTAALASRQADVAPTDDWIAVQVRLVDEAGEPAAGSVSIAGNAFGKDSDRVWTEAESDADGVASLESLPAGRYTLDVKLSVPPMWLHEEIVLGPGRPTELTITCPNPPTETFNLNFTIAPPAGLAKDPLYYTAAIAPAAQVIEGRSWLGRGHTTELLVNHRGNILGSIAGAERVETTIRRPDGRVRHEESFNYTLGEVPPLPVLPTQVSLRGYIPGDAGWTDVDSVPPLRELEIKSYDRYVCRLEPHSSGEEDLVLDAEDGWWSTVRQKLTEVRRSLSEEIQLVVGSPEGVPAVGFLASPGPRGTAQRNVFFGPLETQVNGSGLLRVSDMGQFVLHVTAPWGETATVPVVVGPQSEPGPTRIVCPVEEDVPPAMPIQVKIDEPPEVAGLGLRYLVQLSPYGRTVDGRIWQTTDDDVRHRRFGPSISLIVDAAGSDVLVVTEFQSLPVAGSQWSLLTAAYGQAPEFRAATYMVSVQHVLKPLSAEQLVALQWDANQSPDLIAVQLSEDLVKQYVTSANAQEDEPVAVEVRVVDSSIVDALEQWQRRLTQRVVTVPVDVPVEISGRLKPRQMVDLSVTYRRAENNVIGFETNHLAYGMLITAPERQQGQLEETVPVTLLVDEEDVADITLAAERALLRIGIQQGITAVPSAPVIDRDRLRETLLSLPEDPDKAELIRSFRPPGSGFF